MYELKVVRERRTGYGSCKRFRRSQDVYQAFRDYFENLDREHFVVVLLDGKNILIGFNVVSVGTLSSSIVHPRELFKPAILGNAASVILMHNHPSGDPEPSAEDKTITKRLVDAGELLGIKVLDHIIAGDNRFLSFADAHLL